LRSARPKLILVSLVNSSTSANRKSTPSDPPGEPLTSPLSATIPHTDAPAPFHMPDSDSDDDEADVSLPAPDPDLIAKIQARHLTAKALSGSDVRFGGESSLGTGSKCQVMIVPKIDPGKAADMGAVERGKWETKKAFDAPRVSLPDLKLGLKVASTLTLEPYIGRTVDLDLRDLGPSSGNLKSIE
jgi:hypothetical protein